MQHQFPGPLFLFLRIFVFCGTVTLTPMGDLPVNFIDLEIRYHIRSLPYLANVVVFCFVFKETAKYMFHNSLIS